MTPAITPFLFEGETTVRVVQRDGAPWFVGKDVAGALGYRDTVKAVAAHCKRAVAVGVGEGESPSPLDPQTRIIPEGDVFRLILRSSLPAAQRFEAWLMDDVLPTIRRTGAYLPAATEPETIRLRMVTEARQTFGVTAAAELWFRLGLPVVPAMQHSARQMDLFGPK